MRIAHFAFNFRFRSQGRHRVHDNDVNGVGADERLHNFQRLLAVVRLGNKKLVNFDANFSRVIRVKGVLGVNKGGNPAHLLHLGDNMLGQGCFAGRFRPEDLNDAAARHAADAKSQIHR